MTNPDDLFRSPAAEGNTSSTIRGFKLLELMRWAASADSVEAKEYGKFGLPPVQRGSVWNPKQVVDLWDSVFRGLPIGAFYLVRREAEEEAREIGARGHMSPLGDGWSLLDGQQRLHALIRGWQGPLKSSTGFDPGSLRCLWVELSAPGAETPTLHITSNSQPFGYDPETGRKLRSYQIDEQRNQLLMADGESPVYCRPNSLGVGDLENPIREHELFAGLINGTIQRTQHPKCDWPPKPVLARSPEAVFPLHYLLGAWLAASKDDRPATLEMLFAAAVPKPADESIKILCRAFTALEQAEVALIHVGQPTGENKAQHMLRLFDRIGSGGSPLSTDDRLYSIYKSYKPHIHDAVEQICAEQGAVLPPTKICGVALRIAYARTHTSAEHGNNSVDVPTLMRNMAGPLSPREARGRTSNLSVELDALIPDSGRGGLANAFGQVCNNLSLAKNPAIGLPDLMLATLSPDLLEVFVLAALTPALEYPDYWTDAIVFALLWELLVIDPNYATATCFKVIRSNRPSFSFPCLYAEMVKASPRAILPLVEPDVMRKILCVGSKHVFASWNDRFKPRDAAGSEVANLFTDENLTVARLWWEESGESLLRWQQRSYLQALYQGFKPAFRSDEDMPYDIDHLIPRKEWGDHWSTVEGKLAKLCNRMN